MVRPGDLVSWVNSYYDPPRKEVGMVIDRRIDETKEVYMNDRIQVTVLTTGEHRHGGQYFKFAEPRFTLTQEAQR